MALIRHCNCEVQLTIGFLGKTVCYFPAAALATLSRKAFDPGLLTDPFTIISMGLTALP